MSRVYLARRSMSLSQQGARQQRHDQHRRRRAQPHAYPLPMSPSLSRLRFGSRPWRIIHVVHIVAQRLSSRWTQGRSFQPNDAARSRRDSRRQPLAQLWPWQGYWRRRDELIRRREAFQRGPACGAPGGVFGHRLRLLWFQRVVIVRFEQWPKLGASACRAVLVLFGSVAPMPVHNVSSVPLRNDSTPYTLLPVSM